MQRDEVMAMEVRASEAARLLRLSPKGIKRLIEQGRLQGYQHPNGYWYVTLAALDRYIARRQAEGVALEPIRADFEAYVQGRQEGGCAMLAS